MALLYIVLAIGVVVLNFERVPAVFHDIVYGAFNPAAVTGEVIGKTEIDRAILSDDSGIKPKAPGMKYRHYAPKASLTIVEGEQEKVTAKINELLKEGEAAGEKIGVIASTETAADYLGGIVRTIGSRSDELSISRHLFGILRDFDTLQVDRIYSESFETPQMGQAIMNRLMKAAGHQVMEV